MTSIDSSKILGYFFALIVIPGFLGGNMQVKGKYGFLSFCGLTPYFLLCYRFFHQKLFAKTSKESEMRKIN